MEGPYIMKELIYLDNAATTAVKPEVVDAMLPYFCEKFGNASSIYSIGQELGLSVKEISNHACDNIKAF